MLEVVQQVANLGIIPLLILALWLVWKKWWAMVGIITEKYEKVIAKKDAAIAVLTQTNEDLGEKRLEEYRRIVSDYRDTLEETNKRDDELARASTTNQALLQQLLQQRGGAQ